MESSPQAESRPRTGPRRLSSFQPRGGAPCSNVVRASSPPSPSDRDSRRDDRSGVATAPPGVPVEAHSTGPEPPEHARAIALARARAILAAAVLAEAAGIQAALSIVEHFAHRGRIPARALLMERPFTPEGARRLERLHAAGGGPPPPPDAPAPEG